MKMRLESKMFVYIHTDIYIFIYQHGAANAVYAGLQNNNLKENAMEMFTDTSSTPIQTWTIIIFNSENFKLDRKKKGENETVQYIT